MIEVLGLALNVSNISIGLLGAGLGIIVLGWGFAILVLMECRR